VRDVDGGVQTGGRIQSVKAMREAGKDTSDVPLIDLKRFFKMATFGFFYYGPLNGVWYPMLDKCASPIPYHLTACTSILGSSVAPSLTRFTRSIQRHPTSAVGSPSEGTATNAPDNSHLT
jgi:hypothetical protein